MQAPARYVSDRIVVELAKGPVEALAARPDECEGIDSLQGLIKVLEIADLQPVLERFGDLPVSRLVQTPIRSQVERARRARAPKKADSRGLYGFFAIDVRRIDSAEERLTLLDALRALRGVIASAAFEHTYR